MKAYYSGEWKAGDRRIEVTNPFTEEIFATIPELEESILDEALINLKEGGRELLKTTREERAGIFKSFHEILFRRKEEIAQAISREQGKPLREAELEVLMSLNSVEALAYNTSLIGPRILPLAKEASNNGATGYTVRHPHGVVAIVTPNPQPLILPLTHALFAIAAGNAVALKPSRHSSLVVLILVEMLLESGLPPRAIACFTGTGKKIGRALCRHPLVDHIICSGSLPTIKDVRSRMSFVTSQFQWGCVSTCIVGKTANIELVADQILNTAFESSGQSAFAPTWIACFEKQYDDLRDLLADRMRQLQPGDPFDRRTSLGPVTELRNANRLEDRVKYELEHGAAIVTGSRLGNRLFQPILLGECSLHETRFSRKEIPGPIIGLTRINKAREATGVILSQRHHILTLFSKDEDWAAREAMRMPFNNVHVNGIPTWKDGLICLPGHPLRTGTREASDRISDMSHIRDVVFH
ncbi:MAG: aldehyde dehydrogenase [Verrucomicrobiales bacterium]|nr:aldehyde dehydrogenase [Verrucomicrobiales bacterium]